MIKKVILLVSVVLVAFTLGFNIPIKTTDAHEQPSPYRWYSTTSKHQNINSSWGWAVNESASAYNATDLTSTTTVGATGDGIIYYQKLDLGAGGLVAVAIPYNINNQACASLSGMLNGNCNTTTNKAKIGYVYFNEPTYTSYINNNTRAVYRHETGHIFGLAHPPDCSIPSVMQVGNCPSAVLTVHDTNDINGWY